ncbi:MAG: isoaspartyl peptidase/L-asparaginase [Pirellulaceae bacterium]|jgi:beta-aspartyl-peptidase (threonine type)|nr:isoaspartyl peptidase/L-asparaginase [Pirellulaceae bacterium]
MSHCRIDRRTLIRSAGAAALAAALSRPAIAAKLGKFAICLHGGAGRSVDRFSAEEIAAVEKSLGAALDLGTKVLKEGGTSLDAVEQVVRHLEDDPHFNAGRGAVFNSAGEHELDASIMDGRTKAGGAVAAVRTVRHPISLARLVMEKTRHILLASDGAEKFADEMQVERVENSWYSTERRRAEWERAQKAEKDSDKKQSRVAPPEPYYGTVGCVALDTHGNLAAATSTGGLTNKKYGRVGDSPILGAGTYADNATCASSGTGIGEQFIRHAVTYDLAARMAYKGQSLADAVDDVLKKTLRPGDGGLIAIGADGTIVMDFNTGGMPRAAADSSGKREIKIGR